MANQYTKAKLISKENRREIVWNIVNALIAGFISFLSALIAANELNWKVVLVSIITASLVICVKFKEYWAKEEKEYSKFIFNFIH